MKQFENFLFLLIEMLNIIQSWRANISLFFDHNGPPTIETMSLNEILQTSLLTEQCAKGRNEIFLRYNSDNSEFPMIFHLGFNAIISADYDRQFKDHTLFQTRFEAGCYDFI